MGGSARLAAGTYVAAVATLVGVSFRDPGQGFSLTEGVALALTLPVLVVALPGLYVVGAAAWSVTDAGDGGPMWPVTVVYVVMFAVVAIGNVAVLRWSARRLRRRVART